jgi:putative transposase
MECLEEAIKNYGSPGIFNSDQNSQFTSNGFQHGWPKPCTERLWKYEDIYLKKYDSMQDLLLRQTQYFTFYNGKRRH